MTRNLAVRAWTPFDEFACREPWFHLLGPLSPVFRLERGDKPVSVSVSEAQVIDLGPTGEKVIDVLCEFGCAGITDIANKTGLAYKNVYDTLRRLQNKHYVERCTSCSSACGKETDSRLDLPFFEYRPDSETDLYYCGCFGWD